MCQVRTTRDLVGERGFEPPTPWSRTKSRSKSKCFIRCRLGAGKRVLLSPQSYRSCTESGLPLLTSMGRPPFRVEQLCTRELAVPDQRFTDDPSDFDWAGKQRTS